MLEFKLLRKRNKDSRKRNNIAGLQSLDFRRADFGLFRSLLGRILWDTVQDSCLGGLLLFSSQGLCPPSPRVVHPNTQEIEAKVVGDLCLLMKLGIKRKYPQGSKGQVT